MKQFSLKIDGNKYDVNIKSHKDNLLEVDVNGSTYVVELERKIETKTPIISRAPVKNSESVNIKSVGDKAKKIKSPLPGIIKNINVKEGDTVKIGDTLLVLEAMKMENDIQSEVSGKIKKIAVSSGQNVLQDDVLIEIE